MPKKTVDFNLEVSPFTTSQNVTMEFLSVKDTSKIPSNVIQKSHSENIKLDTSSAKKDFVLLKTNKSANNNFVQTDKVQSAINTENYSSTRVYNEKLPFQTQRSENFESPSGNFLLNIPGKNIFQQYNDVIFIQTSHSQTIQELQLKAIADKTSIVQEEKGFQGNLRTGTSLDWLPGILLLSLFIFSWIKMVYQKYLVQVITSLINYQVSIRLLREKNVLFRNMALGLNFVFSLNIGLFIFFYLQYHNLNQINSSNFISVLIYSSGVVVLYYIKTFACRLIGNLFMVKEQFGEYVHNIHLYNKNIGLFLIPIVVAFPYISSNQIKPVVLYFGLAMIIGMFLMLIYRGFQIIIRNGVSTFYLILYLCAVEILPILLLIKYSYTLI